MTMEQVFSYQFQSESVALLIFAGLAFAGLGLGSMFWIDFRRRSSVAWHVAGTLAMVSGLLMGLAFGYRATQPEYFKRLTAGNEGLALDYHLFGEDALLGWSDIEDISIRGDRLVVEAGPAGRHASAVVYRGDQDRLLRSLACLLHEQGAQQSGRGEQCLDALQEHEADAAPYRR